jgi:integrase
VTAVARDIGQSYPAVYYWVKKCRELGLIGDSQAPAKKRRGLSEKSVWNVHVCLRAALYDAMHSDPPLLRRNPAAGLMKQPDGDKEMLTWTREELDTFMEFAAGERDFALWWTIAYSGMRRGEALGLRWSDVRWNLNTLSVQQQLGLDDDDDGERDFAPPKTRHGRRPIGMDEDTMRVLREHRAAQEFERRSWGPKYRSDLDLVFCRPDGSPQSPNNVTTRFERAVERSPVKAIGGPHGLRHTYATLSLEAGVDISVVSKQLGHSSVAVTAAIYAHVTERLRLAAAGKLRAYITKRDDRQSAAEVPAARERSVSESDTRNVR